MRNRIVSAAVALAALACSSGAPIGTVSIGDLTTQGVVDPDYLYLQLGQLDPPFEACYVRALRRGRTTKGVIELTLRGGGSRLTSEITSNGTEDAELAQCVTAAIAGLTIREPEETAPWDYTAEWSVTFDIIARGTRPLSR